MPSKKMQRNAEVIRREMRGMPWQDAFAKLAPLPGDELVDLFDCMVFNHADMRDIREFAVVRPIQHQFGFELKIGLSISTTWDIALLFHTTTNNSYQVVYHYATAAIWQDSGFTFSDVLGNIREGILRQLRAHTTENIQQAIDTFKLAALCKMYNAVPVEDLAVLSKYFAQVAKHKRTKAENRVVRIKEAKEALASVEGDVASTPKHVTKKKPSRPRISIRGFKWYEADSEQAIDAQGFLLMEQTDGGWLVSYNNRAPVRAWNETAACELVQDITKDPTRLREFVATHDLIRAITIVRLNKQ